jgi:hypothetical protein
MDYDDFILLVGVEVWRWQGGASDGTDDVGRLLKARHTRDTMPLMRAQKTSRQSLGPARLPKARHLH